MFRKAWGGGFASRFVDEPAPGGFEDARTSSQVSRSGGGDHRRGRALQADAGRRLGPDPDGFSGRGQDGSGAEDTVGRSGSAGHLERRERYSAAAVAEGGEPGVLH